MTSKKSVPPPRSSVKSGSRARSEDSSLVLIVDDFDDNRVMYVEYLQFQGFEVAEAVNGQDALDKTNELLPKVVVMDLSLPVMDGWEATRRIKANPKTKHIVVIALTGHAEPAHAKKARDAGCDDFVAKPCLPEHLVERIRHHVSASQDAGPTRRKTPMSSTKPEARAGQKGKK